MTEHADDLEAQVLIDAEQELNAPPDPGDPLDDLIQDAPTEEKAEGQLDDPRAEL